MAYEDDGKKFEGRTDQSILDIKEDLKDLTIKIDKLTEKIDKNTSEIKGWCNNHYAENVKEVAEIKSEMKLMKESKTNITKLGVAIISALCGLGGTIIGAGGLIIIEIVKGIIK